MIRELLGTEYDNFIKEVCNEKPEKLWGAIIVDKNANNVPYVSLKNIIKASFNIIDILEVGDFLDNHCIIKIENDTCYLNDGWFINADDIENLVTSICTKELFKQISYKVGE